MKSKVNRAQTKTTDSSQKESSSGSTQSAGFFNSERGSKNHMFGPAIVKKEQSNSFFRPKVRSGEKISQPKQSVIQRQEKKRGGLCSQYASKADSCTIHGVIPKPRGRYSRYHPENLKRYGFQLVREGEFNVWTREKEGHLTIVMLSQYSRIQKSKKREKTGGENLMTILSKMHGDIIVHKYDVNVALGLNQGDAFLFENGVILFHESKTGKRYVLKPTVTIAKSRGTHNYRVYDPEGNQINEIGLFGVEGAEDTKVRVNLDHVFEYDTIDGKRIDTDSYQKD